MRLDLPPRPVIENQVRSGDTDLTGDELNRLISHCAPPGREPAGKGEVLQQHREAQARRARLVAQQRHLVGQQREVPNELVELELTAHAHAPATATPAQDTRTLLLDQPTSTSPLVTRSLAAPLTDRGVIEPGGRADLVLVDGDPLNDITHSRRITRVWRGGVPCDRSAFVGSAAEDEQLDALHAQVEKVTAAAREFFPDAGQLPDSG